VQQVPLPVDTVVEDSDNEEDVQEAEVQDVESVVVEKKTAPLFKKPILKKTSDEPAVEIAPVPVPAPVKRVIKKKV
jgi:hypothetical protein